MPNSAPIATAVSYTHLDVYKRQVNRRKVELAKDRLRNTSISIAQIADDLSFSDSSYFVKTFKKFEGITPSVYRRHKYR